MAQKNDGPGDSLAMVNVESTCNNLMWLGNFSILDALSKYFPLGCSQFLLYRSSDSYLEPLCSLFSVISSHRRSRCYV